MRIAFLVIVALLLAGSAVIGALPNNTTRTAFDARHSYMVDGRLVYRLPYIVNISADGAPIDTNMLATYPTAIDHGLVIYNR